MISNNISGAKLRFALLLAFAMPLVSCSHQPQIRSYVGDAPPELPPHFTGMWLVWHKNGRLSRKTPYVDGQKHGTEITWDSEGRKLMAIGYSNGMPHGSAITYFPNGRIKYLSKLDMGRCILRADYFDNGQIKNEVQRNGDCHHGIARSWYRNGQLQWEGNFSMGVRVGKSRSWHENGQLKSEGGWANGQKHGVHKWWNATGKLSALGLYWYGEEVEGTFVDETDGKTVVRGPDSSYRDYERIDTPKIISLLEEAALAHIETTHSQRINIILKNGRKYRGLYRQAESGKYADTEEFFDIYNLVRHILDRRNPEDLKDVTISLE